MKKTETLCDLCSTRLKGQPNIDYLSRSDVDICKKCLELEYHRIVLGEVPDNAMGWRQLGVYS